MKKQRIRDKQIIFFVTERELEKINKKSVKAKTNRSEYIRKCILDKDITINEIKDLEEFKKFIFEINRIGVNLHQLLKKINYNEDLEEDFKILFENQKKLDLVLDEILKVSEKVQKWQ